VDDPVAEELAVAAPVKPAIIALVAAGLTLLVLLVVILVATRTSAPAKDAAAEQPAGATKQPVSPEAPAPALVPPPAAKAPAPSLGGAAAPISGRAGAANAAAAEEHSSKNDAAATEPAKEQGTPKQETAPTQEAAPSTTTSAPDADAQVAPSDAPSTQAPPSPSPAPTAQATPSPAPPAPSAPAAVPTVFLKPESIDGSLRGGVDLRVAGLRGLRFRVPPSLPLLPVPGTGAADGAALEIAASKLRVAAHMEGPRCVLSALLVGEAAKGIPAAFGEPSASPAVALQHALERCTLEAIDGAGAVVGRVQFRAWGSSVVAPGTATRAPVKVPDLGSQSLFVQLVPPAGMPTPSVERIDARESRTLAVGAWLMLTVDRTIDKEGAILRAQAQDRDAISARRSALTSEINALNSTITACRAFDAASAKGTSIDDLQLGLIDAGITAEERRQHLGAVDAKFASATSAKQRAASAAIKQRLMARLDGASAELAEANLALKASDAKAGTAPRWQVRILNDDGLVLHDGPVAATGGGK
jgi:hypothetical protein